MKILVVNGSPRRKGNTSRLLDLVLGAAARAAEEAGTQAEVRSYVLNDLVFRGCQGCMECKKEMAKGCAQVDDLTPVLDLMKEADAWVIGTPIYGGYVSGQLKLCFDRIYGFMGPNRVNRLPPGKKVVIAVTQGRPDPETYKNVYESLSQGLSGRGMSVRTIVAGGMGSAMTDSFPKDVEETAKAAGAWLTQTG